MSSPTTHFAPTSHSEPPIREIVELACRAPSVHNTQPWVWRARGHEIELHADRQRQLTYADTLGRNLILSCGAALNHAQVAAAGLGWHTSVTRNPKDRDPDHLATITVTPGRLTTESEADLRALEERRTDRRRFTSWPVPEERLTNLATSVAGWGALAVPVTDSGTRGTLERLILRADDVQRHDPRYAAEAERWVARSAEDGVPLASIPEDHPHRPERPSRFTHGELPDVPPEAIEGSDALMVLCTVRDDAASWLRCGETLGALWLSAVRKGLSLVPLSQVLEVEETRAALREAVLGGMATPQLLLRIGWQEVARAPLPPTPRRPLEEVLRP
jgi:hypothetical protein